MLKVSRRWKLCILLSFVPRSSGAVELCIGMRENGSLMSSVALRGRSASVPSLSRRHYAAGRQCLKRLWLQVFAPAAGQGDNPIANGGEDMRRAARALYPGGVVVDSAPGSDDANFCHTRSLMAGNSCLLARNSAVHLMS